MSKKPHCPCSDCHRAAATVGGRCGPCFSREIRRKLGLKR